MPEGAEQIPAAQRRARLRKDGYSCAVCPADAPKAGGVANLEVHHKNPDLEGELLHHVDNLITLCEGCHSWIHKRPTSDEVPVEITDADREALLPHDYRILKILHESGPLSTGEVQDRLSFDLSTTAVRERLWLLMGLDQEVESREEPLVDQDAATGAWGLPGQIGTSERGRIPSDLQSLIRRVQDERVREALARGVDRSTVIDVMGIAERTSWYKQRRAQAYAFPLNALEQGDAIGADEGVPATSGERSTGAADGEDQRQLGAVQSGEASRESGEDAVEGLGEPDAVWPPEDDGNGEDRGGGPFTTVQEGGGDAT
ncbi:HNH endonuclease [Salinarchaeum laminariae]|uniref:HNH endonuclease n=1 Tax=Salinarchaeum laminariae TaxID=869888 RepID=UPI0020C09FF2|nr:HNH endonuclease signature motif containing protein [Salinarchaeum laminariae]